jgi:hypothetical protein
VLVTRHDGRGAGLTCQGHQVVIVGIRADQSVDWIRVEPDIRCQPKTRYEFSCVRWTNERTETTSGENGLKLVQEHRTHDQAELAFSPIRENPVGIASTVDGAGNKNAGVGNDRQRPRAVGAQVRRRRSRLAA